VKKCSAPFIAARLAGLRYNLASRHDRANNNLMADRERYIRITPDMWIHGPYVDCPACRATSSLGVVSISDHSYTRRCRKCLQGSTIALPRLARKLIYLDQLAVSDMMKAINPNLDPERKARVLPFWERAISPP
jgi:hypothetical protein